MSDRRIKHTKNYKLFERTTDNRPCDPAKRRPLMESMKKYGWIPSFPAVCRVKGNGKIEIEDGQHRIAIAETLGIEIWYVLEEVQFDVAIVNSGQRPWVLNDYARRYADQGSSDYREAIEFREKNKLPIGMAFALLGGTTSFCNVENSFRSGSFRIKDRKWAEDVAAIYGPFVEASRSVRNARFLEACMAVCRIPGFDRDRLLRGLARCRDKLTAYSNRDAYLQMIEEVYNFGCRQLVGIKVAALNAMKSRNPAKEKIGSKVKCA